MSPRILVIALDAAEADLLSAGAADGRCPNLGKIAAEGVTAALSNSMEFLPGTIWTELHTGRVGWRDGRFCHVAQLHAGEARLRQTRADEVGSHQAWFNVAAREGRRVVVVDPVQMLGDVGPDGVSVDQWHMHDDNWDLRVHPPEVAALVDEAGAVESYPVCDEVNDGTTGGFVALLGALRASIDAKRDLTLALLERPFDAAFVTFTESHCAGHHFWHFRDPASPFHVPDAPPELRDAVSSVYGALDGAVGALAEAAGDDTLVVVVTSHGMEWERGGPAMLKAAVERLGYGSSEPPLMSVRRRVPAPVRRLLRRVVPARVVDAVGVDSVEFERGARVRAMTVPNNRAGAVRVRVRDRDAGGVVEPTEVEGLVRTLRAQLGRLRTVDGDEPVVAATITPAEAFGPGAHPDLPDLLVDFRRDVGPLDRVHSPDTGVIEVPMQWDWLPRTGDHTDHTRIWASGPGSADLDLGHAAAVDLAPTLLDVLGVDVPAGVDGVSRKASTAAR